ncbi:ABC transporter permease [Paenibacillus helianthi]|uniref:ABC transporter permease n=1 Tax=Paenibacillus helianthi TaxID=1349432 RepID=A0ABX3ET01_9BACL|nr:MULTISPECIES: ABC transporter permease subunit [Paenibacillus]OKP82395.1 ABC transporter permease [Paenibacillus sp. P3E]OKP84558.1 ABC transporter permease [Paenibacillus sp. P32E]OKP86875.1 ABC transporter permease [Paenibacillus helianthi]
MGVPSGELLRGVGPVRPSRRKLQNKYKLFLMALPFLVVTFVFYYLPVSGWIYAFYDFIPGIPLSDTPYVGLKWFRTIVANPTQTAEVLRVLKNTVAMSSLGLVTSVFPVIFAILLTEIRAGWYRKFVQTLTTIPNFISWILVYALAFSLFSVDNGVVNHILIQLGFVNEEFNFLASSSHIWVTMIAWYWWKSLGWGAILYLAAIAGIDQELYEAAEVDGASRFRKIWHITVPGLIPTFFVLLLLSIGNFVNNGMEQYFAFQNAMNKDAIEVLDLYVYNIAFANNFPFATAVSMLKSVVSVILLFAANTLSKVVRDESII